LRRLPAGVILADAAFALRLCSTPGSNTCHAQEDVMAPHRPTVHAPALPAAPLVAPSAQLLARIRAEYREMPGLRLTLVQARRLWGLDIMTCASALSALQAAGFLHVTRDGAYLLADAERLTA
jgi:hypothetical protein